jgi:Uma2 family endonuclease
VLRLIQCENKTFAELVDGVLLEKTMGVKESFLAMWLGTLLNIFVVPRKLGMVLGADGLARVLPGQIRIPAVSFSAWSTIPLARGAEFPAIATWAPDLCVEVLSESNTRREMQHKRIDYFRGGAKLVWEIHPYDETVTVMKANRDMALC